MQPVADPLVPLLDLPGVADGVADARAAVDALLGNRALRRRSADVSAESSLRGAWASAVLSGADVSLDAVRAGSQDEHVQGALRAMAELPAVAGTWPRAPRQALARLHAVAATGLAPAEALGRPTAGAGRLDTLAAVLGATTVPAVIVAALVHGELLSLDAFAPVSGIVARTAARLVLVDRGLDPKSLVVLEAGHLELRDDYAAALDAYRGATPDGIAHWLRHCAAAVVAGARESTAICQAMTRG